MGVAIRTVVAAIALLGLVAATHRIVGTEGPDKLGGTAGPDFMDGGGGRDSLKGEAGNDVLIGGPGQDELEGGVGDDVFLFRGGDGQDRIDSGDATQGRRDVIRFGKGILPSMVTLSRLAGNSLVVQYGRGDRITVMRHFELDAYGPFRIDAIVFAGGKTWNDDYIRKAVLKPTPGAQYISGYASNDKLSGEGGNDQIYGAMGNDILLGGEGNDRLYGDEGDDTLVGGPGDDVLRGELGSDTYIYRAGDGMDTVLNYSRPGDVDVIRFLGMSKGAVKISTRGNDLMLIVEDGGRKKAGIKVSGFNATNSYPINRIEYAEGKPTTLQELLALFPVNAKLRATVANPKRRPGQAQSADPKKPAQSQATTPSRRIQTPLDPYTSSKDSGAQQTPTSPTP